MADRVVRITGLMKAGHVLRNGEVVLQVTGTTGKQTVRVEIALGPWEVNQLPRSIRAGVKEQLQRWLDATAALKEEAR